MGLIVRILHHHVAFGAGTAVVALLAEAALLAAQTSNGTHVTPDVILAACAIVGALATIFRAIRALEKATKAMADIKPTAEAMTADLAQAKGLEGRMVTTETAITGLAREWAELRSYLVISDKPGQPTLVEYLRDWRHDQNNVATKITAAVELLVDGLHRWQDGIDRLTTIAEAVAANQLALTQLTAERKATPRCAEDIAQLEQDEQGATSEG